MFARFSLSTARTFSALKLAALATVALLAAALLTAAGLGATAAHAVSPDATVTLSVTGAGETVVGGDVSVYRFSNGAFTYVEDTNISDGTGDIPRGEAVFTNLKSDTAYAYKVAAPDSTNDFENGDIYPGNWAQTWGGADTGYTAQDAGAIAAVDGQTISIDLLPAYSISGTVTNQDGTASGFQFATAYRVDPSNPDGAFAQESYTHGNSDGTYEIDGLRPGEYKIQYAPSDATSGYTWWGNVPDAADADIIDIDDSNATGADATLLAGYSLGGTLNDSNNTAATDSQVSLYEADGTTEVTSSGVDGDGNFSFTGVPNGSYKLRFDTNEPGQFGDWYSDQTDATTATDVDVDDGGPTDLTANLSGGATISGVVSDADGNPVSNAQVSAIVANGGYVVDADGNPQQHFDTSTSGDGSYSLQLPPGHYVYEVTSNDLSFDDQYAKGSTSTYDLSAASQTAFAVGSHTQNIMLLPLNTLTVHVANKAGASLSSVDVSATPVTGGVASDTSIEATPVPGHAGTYLLSGLSLNQNYALQFIPFGSSAVGTYPQYLGGAGDIEHAQLYKQVGPTGLVDATLASNSSISGVVTSSSNNKGIKNVVVDLLKFDGSNWREVNEVATSSSGAYSFPNLETGSYTIDFLTFIAAPYVETFAGGAADPASATHVYVAPGKPAVLNQKLVAGGSISGVVTGPGGSPKVSGLYVNPIALQGTPGHFTSAQPVVDAGGMTGSTGKFTVTSLPTGYYALSYTDTDEVYGDSYDNPVTNPSSTSPIYHVTAGKATLVPGVIKLPFFDDVATATFSGTLDTSAVAMSSPIGSIYFYDAEGNFVDATEIDGDGNYSINLAPGTYNYVASFWDEDSDSSFADEAGTVHLNASAVTTVDIPAELELPLAFVPTPSIVDATNTKVGTTYVLNGVSIDRPLLDSSFAYQWMRGAHPIYGATNATYTSQGADLGLDLHVVVTASDQNGDTVTSDVDVVPSVTSSDQLFNTARPTSSTDATSELAFGQTAKSTPGVWNNISGLTYTYKWVNCADSSILSSTATFTPTADQVGDSVRLEVQASKPGYDTPAFKRGHSFEVVLAAPPTVKVAPKLTSKTVGATTTYMVTPGTWSVAGTSPSYTWVANGTTTVSSTNSYAYVAQPAGSQPSITVTVAASKDGYQDGSTMVIARKGDSTYTSTATAEDTTTGDPIVGQTDSVTFGDVLTAGTAGISSSDAASTTVFGYQWQRATTTGAASTVKFANIAGGTHAAYTVGTADTGRQLRVLVTASSPTHVAQALTEVAGIANLRQDLVDDADGAHVDVQSDSWQPGTKLVGGLLPWGASVKNSYQWLICAGATCTDPTNATQFVAIKGATGSSYTPPFTMALEHIALRVIGSQTGYASATMYSLPQQIADGKTIVVLTPPAIASGLVSGMAKIGAKLTVKSGTYNVAGVVPTYQWQTSTNLSDWDNATTGTTYTVTSSSFDLGVKGIRVVETAAKAGYSEPGGVVNASAAGSLALTATTLKVAPKVSLVAGSWVVTPPVWSNGATSNYAWSVNGSLTINDTNTFASSTVSAGDIVTVVVTSANKAGYESAGATLVAQKAAAPTWNSPTVGGTAKFGSALTAPTDPAVTFNFTSAADGALSYQWYSASTSSGSPVAISKATGSSFTPSTAYINKWISVKVTLTSSKYATASHLTAPVQFVSGDALDLDAAVSNSAPHPGSTVSAVLSNLASVTGQVHTYQWQTSTDSGATWANVSGATKSSYVVLAGDLAKQLRVTVATTKAGYTTAHDNSAGVVVVQATVLQPTTQPTLAGNTAAGSVLTANPGVWNVASTFTYQWFRDGDIIPGATGTTHTTTGDEDGENITVQVTAHASGYSSVTVAPADIQVTDGAAPSAITAPKVTGTASVGSTLTATSGVWSLDDLVFTYQWQASTDGGATWTSIPDATNSTYVVDPAYAGQKLHVVVTATRAGYTSKSVASNLITIPGVV